MYATNHFEKEFLNTMRGISLTAPAKLYVAFFISNPGESGSGTEIVYEGYERKEITFSVPAYDNEIKAICIKNDKEITFPTSPTDAGTVTHIGIMDSKASGTGNMWAYAQAREDLIVSADEAPVLVAGELIYYTTGTLSESYQTKLLNVFRGQSISGFTAYMALFNGNPDSGGAELSGDNYARVKLTFTAPKEAESGQMIIQNESEAKFNRPSTAWGTWNYTALYDASSGGNPVWILEKKPGKEIQKNHMPIMAEGSVKAAIN